MTGMTGGRVWRGWWGSLRRYAYRDTVRHEHQITWVWVTGYGRGWAILTLWPPRYWRVTAGRQDPGEPDRPDPPG